MKQFPTIKIFVLTCLVVMPWSSVRAQSFEGTITYVQDIELPETFKKMGLTHDMMIQELRKKGSWADTVRVTYRQGDYASVGNNEDQLTKIYKSVENKIYSFSVKGSRDICAVQDAVDLTLNGEPDKPIVTEKDSVVTIMGKSCKIIRMKWPMTKVDYYYNATQAKVNPDLFSKHSTEGFAEFIKMTKCLPLQKVMTSMGMNIIQTAVEIKPGKANPGVFNVPTLVDDESLNIIKMPGIKAMRIKRD